MLKIGLLGLGAIGSDVIEMAKNEFADRIEIPAVLVRRPRDPATINRTVITNDFDAFFSKETDLMYWISSLVRLNLCPVEKFSFTPRWTSNPFNGGEAGFIKIAFDLCMLEKYAA